MKQPRFVPALLALLVALVPFVVQTDQALAGPPLLAPLAGEGEVVAGAGSDPRGLEALAYEALVRSVEAGSIPGADSALSLRVPEGATARADGLAPSSLVCLPSCDVTDGRFIALAPNGPSLDTLSDEDLEFSLAVPAGTSSFTVGFFDGDTGLPHWDLGTGVLEFDLYADPLRDGTGTLHVASYLGSAMPDDDWVDFTVLTGPEAEAPSGNFFYRLTARLTLPSSNPISSFKLRTSAVVTIEVFQQPIGFTAQMISLDDALTIYPAFPDLTPTTNDGSFDFFLDVPEPQKDLILWDGDLDRGKYDGTDLDTDDPNTPNNVKPPWAVTNPSARFEGVAFSGTRTGVGNPPDDRNPAGLGIYLLKAPSIRYDVLAPDGQVFANDNPSGNAEWERFRLTTGPFDPLVHDAATSSLPAGTYQVRLEGLDLQNLNAFFFFRPVLCVDAVGEPCPSPPRPFLVGDTVFLDLDGNGVQDAGEPGIAGVVVHLLSDDGELMATTVTGADGGYLFEVEGPLEVAGEIIRTGTYSVEIAPENFAPGGVLEGATPTTAGGNLQTDTVLDANVLTYDFGYLLTGSIGDRVWLDLDADGVQDAGEPGLAGVTVRLLDGDGQQVSTALTDADGLYTFDGLLPGTYTVVVDATTLPPEVAQTFDADGLATPHRASVVLGIGEDLTELDFGYAGCGECEGKVTRLLLQYLGPDAQVRVVARRGPDRDVVFDGALATGEVFEVVGPATGTPGFQGTLGTEIEIFVDGVLHTVIHTSCSVPIGPGFTSGDFTVLYGESSEGGVLCPLEGCTTCSGEGSTTTAPGTGTVGFWRNHPDAWSLGSLVLGTATYSRQEALELLATPTRGRASILLATQLVATLLNLEAGNEASCIADTVAAAREWLVTYGLGAPVPGQARRQAVELAARLDDYNRGHLCAPHRGG